MKAVLFGAFVAVPFVHAAHVKESLDLCDSYSRVCGHLVGNVDCSTHFDKWASHKVVHNSGCLSDNVYDSYVGQCKCASLDASEEVLRELVDYSVTTALPIISPVTSGTVDTCNDYVEACDTLLSASSCPPSLKIVKGCDSSGITGYQGRCQCGTIDASRAVSDAMLRYLVRNKLSTTAVTKSNGDTNVCSTFTNACSDLFTQVACPAASQRLESCSAASDPSTFDGECKCGRMDATVAVLSEVLSHVGTKLVANSIVTSAYTTNLRDFCGSYTNLCASMLAKVGNCTDASKTITSGCVGDDNLGTFEPTCTCGGLDLTNDVTSLLIAHEVNDVIPTLVCMGRACDPYRMNAGVLAIIVISVVLASLAFLGYAYVKGEAWARHCISTPFWRRMAGMTPFHSHSNMARRTGAPLSHLADNEGGVHPVV